MRQAIEEGFILDVLQNYTTYRNYYRLARSIPDNPEMPTTPAMKAARRFEELHPCNLREKAQLVKAVRVHETLPVSPELWGDFVRMTPLNHDLSAAEKDALAQRADAHVTVDLHVALCRFR